MTDVNARIEHLEGQCAEILALLKDVSRTMGDNIKGEAHYGARKKINAKAIIKQGMTAYYSCPSSNPFAAGSDENEYWQFGYDNERNTWDEIRK